MGNSILKFYVLTIFPEIFQVLKEYSVLGRAIKKGLIELQVINLRDYTQDKHRSTDDYTYGGGPGMVMLSLPIVRALSRIAEETKGKVHTILLGPQGEKFTQKKAYELALKKEICLICGHYEGVDARIKELCQEEISLGDFVTTGGELPAMVLIDVVSRLAPGVLGNLESLGEESFTRGLLEYDQYTRPRELTVPEILVSGNHGAVSIWRLKNSLLKTLLFRPELLLERDLSPDELKLLQEIWETLEKILLRRK